MLESHKSSDFNGFIEDSFDDQTIVFTDKISFYVDISTFVQLHVTEKSNEKTTNTTLKWVHILISNAKRTFLENHDKIKRKYLQLNQNEFVYKLNRRYFGEKTFDRLIIADIGNV